MLKRIFFVVTILLILLIGAFFAVGYVMAVAWLAVLGIFGRDELVLGLSLLPGVGLGYLVAGTPSLILEAEIRVVLIGLVNPDLGSWVSDQIQHMIGLLKADSGAVTFMPHRTMSLR